MAYDQAVKAEGLGHKRGAPRPYVLAAVLGTWLKDLERQFPRAARVIGQLRQAAEDDAQQLAIGCSGEAHTLPLWAHKVAGLKCP